jgi:hypothetical protein
MAAGIRTLSVEIIERIYHYLAPASHLDFALADKHLLHYSHGILERHYKYYCSYQTCTDEDPEALLSILRNVATDHIAAWHLRNFKGFDTSILQTSYRAKEVELIALAKTVHAAMVVNGIPPFSLRRLRNGDFESLQTALLALSTGLHTVQSTHFFPVPQAVVIQESSDDLWNEAEIPSVSLGHYKFLLLTTCSEQYTEHKAHNFFTDVVRAYHELSPQPSWPPGFDNLRTIMIGVPFADVTKEPVALLTPSNVAPLFLLPNINAIYLQGLYEAEYVEDPFGSDFYLPEHSSSVQHLFLERAHPECVKNAVNAFVKSAKSLTSLLVKDCEFNNFDMTVDFAVNEHNGGALQTLLWSEEEGDLRGYRSSKFYPEESVSAMRHVRILALDIEDVLNGCSAGYSSKEYEDKVEDYDYSHADFEEYFYYLVGDEKGIEVLVFKIDSTLVSAGTVRVVNDAIVALSKWHEDDWEEAEEEVEEEEEERKEGEEGREAGQDESEHTGEDESEDKLGQEDEDKVGTNEETGISHLHIYLDEVVARVVKEGTEVRDAEFGRSLFEEAIRCGREHGITLHLDEGATSRYFKDVCDGLFKLEVKRRVK